MAKTRLEIMNANKKAYAMVSAAIPSMKGIEKDVATHITLAWIKGEKNWLGGLGGGKYCDRAYDRAMACGYTLEEVDKEFNRQMHKWLPVIDEL